MFPTKWQKRRYWPTPIFSFDRALVWELIVHNPADRDGALLTLIGCYKYLKLMAQRFRQGQEDAKQTNGLMNKSRNVQTNLRFLATVNGVRGYKRVTIPGGDTYWGGDPLLDQIASKFPDDGEIQEHVARCRKAVERFKGILEAKMPRKGRKR